MSVPVRTVPLLPVVQVSDRIWLKRDDVYQPFGDTAMNGAKTYQCMNLIGSHLDQIQDRYHNTIYSDNFMGSPQGPIVARVAKHYGLRCIIPVAAASLESAMTNRSMQLVQEWGGEVVPVCKMGFALKSKATKTYGDQYFRVKFGMGGNADTILSAVVEPVRRQAQAFIGLPTNTMTLVVAVGSGVAFGSLLVGMADLGIQFKKIIGIQIAGYDRTPTVKRIVESCGYTMSGTETAFFLAPQPAIQAFDFLPDKTYPYDRHLDRKVGDVVLDSQYEAKAWNWVVRQGMAGKDPIMFYVIGNSNCLR